MTFLKSIYVVVVACWDILAGKLSIPGVWSTYTVLKCRKVFPLEIKKVWFGCATSSFFRFSVYIHMPISDVFFQLDLFTNITPRN